MLRTATLVLFMSGWFVATAVAPAHEFAIDLRAQSGRASQTAHAEQGAIGQKPKPRRSLELKAVEAITVTWSLRNADKTAVNDVVVHCFVVLEKKAGQPEVPQLDKGVVAETALTMDFNPKDKAEGEMTFRVAKPGAYLLRLETVGAATGVADHESYAALDLVVR